MGGAVREPTADVLERAYDRVRADRFWDPLRGPGIRLIRGVGAEAPLVFVVGEAPGATENQRVRPFCGAAGVVLQGLMANANLSPDTNAFMTYVVKYRLPGGRRPTVGETLHGRVTLRQEYAAVGHPKIVVSLGATARSAMYPSRDRIPVAIPCVIPDTGVTLIPMLDPRLPLAHPEGRAQVERQWEDLGAWIAERIHHA